MKNAQQKTGKSTDKKVKTKKGKKEEQENLLILQNNAFAFLLIPNSLLR
jgi:hypothetical protein